MGRRRPWAPCPVTGSTVADQKPLSERERRFVLAMTGEAAGNLTEAAKIAGYSPLAAAKAGWRLSKRVHIQQAMAARVQKLHSAVDLRDIRILEEIAKVGYADVAIKGSEKVKALELLAKHKGLLQTEVSPASRVTVNIGFLNGSAQPTVTVKELTHGQAYTNDPSPFTDMATLDHITVTGEGDA